MTDLTGFDRLWDGTDPGWVVIRHVEDREHLVVTFAGGAKIGDLKALRTVVPSLTSAPAERVMELKGALTFDLGEHESASARRLKALCAERQLTIQSSGKQYLRYGIFNELTRVYWLIEDEQTCQAVAIEAIKRGLHVRESIV